MHSRFARRTTSGERSAQALLFPGTTARQCPAQQCEVYDRHVALANEKYMLFTTFRRDGTPVSTPVWIVDLGDNRLGFWTSSGSGKAKRLAHTSRVIVQPSNVRGSVKAGTDPVEATARLAAGDELDAIRQRVIAKYGFATKVTKLLGEIWGLVRGKRIPYGDRGVIVTLPPGS
jgi:uncharacterized protein